MREIESRTNYSWTDTFWIDENGLAYKESWEKKNRRGLLFPTGNLFHAPDAVKSQSKESPRDAPIRCRCGSSTFIVRYTDDYETSAFCSQCECSSVVHSG